MQELIARDVYISDSFWSPRQTVNAQTAIFHQWEQLESSRCIDNFRIDAFGAELGPELEQGSAFA